jgi:hypothetical protein
MPSAPMIQKPMNGKSRTKTIKLSRRTGCSLRAFLSFEKVVYKVKNRDIIKVKS